MTWAVVAWTAVASAAASIGSASKQAETVRKGAELAKNVSDTNSEFAELDAFQAEQLGYSKQARYEGVINQVEGEQKTMLAAADIDGNFGTAAQLQAETKLNGFLNALDIKNQGFDAANGYKTEARNLRLAGIMGMAQAGVNASAIEAAGTVNAVGTLASGASGYAKSKAGKQ